MVMDKEKKIGVKFKKVKLKKYCYITYDKSNTRFAWNVPIDQKIDETEFIRNCVRFIIDMSDEFKLKGIGFHIHKLAKPLNSVWIQRDALLQLGNYLTYNQYIPLKTKVTERENYIKQLYQFLSFKSSINLNFDYSKSLNLLNDLEKYQVVSYITLNVFETENSTRLLNWLIEEREHLDRIKKFYKSNKKNLSDMVEFHVPIIPISEYVHISKSVELEIDYQRNNFLNNLNLSIDIQKSVAAAFSALGIEKY